MSHHNTGRSTRYLRGKKIRSRICNSADRIICEIGQKPDKCPNLIQDISKKKNSIKKTDSHTARIFLSRMRCSFFFFFFSVPKAGQDLNVLKREPALWIKMPRQFFLRARKKIIRDVPQEPTLFLNGWNHIFLSISQEGLYRSRLSVLRWVTVFVEVRTKKEEVRLQVGQFWQLDSVKSSETRIGIHGLILPKSQAVRLTIWRIDSALTPRSCISVSFFHAVLHSRGWLKMEGSMVKLTNTRLKNTQLSIRRIIQSLS